MVLPGTLPDGQPPSPAAPSRSEWRKWSLGAAGALVAFLVVVKVLSAGSGAGSYEFLRMQGGSPVTWNHCAAIPYQVNPKGAPPDWEKIVHRAIDDLERASGFVFADRGTTVKTQLIGVRYQGNEWEPVLIMWSDRYQKGALDGGVIGLGGPAAVDVNGRLRYVVGEVALDSSVRDPKDTQMVLEHELGHVLGLAHTRDRHQLMYPGYHGQDGLGAGDINGLKRLHDVPCD